MGIVATVSSDPDIVLMIDGYSVIGTGPVVAFPGPSPMSQQISFSIKLQDIGSRNTALSGRRIRSSSDLGPLVEGVPAVNHPHVISGVH